MRTLYVAGCKCEVCQELPGYTEEDRERVLCEYAGIKLDVIRLHKQYLTLVDQGRVNLLDLPYYMVEVAEMVDEAKATQETKKLQEDNERRKQREMLQKSGLV